METLYKKAQLEAEAERYAEYEALIPIDCNDEDLKKWSDSIQKAFIAGAEYTPDTTAQLKADKAELLEALETCNGELIESIKQLQIIGKEVDFQSCYEIDSIIQKMKQ